jgi:hypothetical protein
MKLLMSIPTLLTVIAVAIVIALIPLSPLPLSASSDSDETETNAEQRLQQKNLGSGESDNFNCDENMITSASGVDCIPSGPTAPTPPPPPPTGGISGTVSGEILCGTIAVQRSVFINVFENDDGTVGGIIEIGAGGPLLDVNGGTTDGNTFSISGPIGICSGAFTISGDCGTDIMVSYEEDDASGTLTGDVECTLL